MDRHFTVAKTHTGMDFTALLGSNSHKGEHFTVAKTHPWMDFTVLGSHFTVAKTHTWADTL